MNFKSAIGPGMACGFALVTGLNTQTLVDQTNPPRRVAGLNAHESHASASLLGQFRTNGSSWLWLRTDLYLHNGVELRPLTQAEKSSGRNGVGSAESDLGEAMGDDNVVTAIPSKQRDFRGWLGDLERATAPYMAMENHTHNEPKQALPLFRLMTWLDPSFIEGWTTGATVIARERSQAGTQRSLYFLHEGLAANPGNVSILNNIAFMHITRNRDLRTAIRYLEEARSSGQQTRQALAVEDMEELQNVYRWLSLCYRDLGGLSQMGQVLTEGRQVFPEDPVLAQLSNTPPLILTAKGQRKWNSRHSKPQDVAGGRPEPRKQPLRDAYGHDH